MGAMEPGLFQDLADQIRMFGIVAEEVVISDHLQAFLEILFRNRVHPIGVLQP